MALEWLVKVGGASGTVLENVQVTSLKMGYAFPRECSLFFPGDHDVGVDELTNNNEIWVSTDNFSTLVFRGFLEVNSPKGIRAEGVEYTAFGLEAAANQKIIKYNGSIDYSYNIDNLPDFSSPNAFGGRWQVGQIMIDILEHAMGLPTGGSDIPKHHPVAGSVSDPYISASILKSYDKADILALDLELAEVRVTAQRFWDYLRQLVELEDHHGIFIDPSDPDDPHLVLHSYSTSTTVDFKFGQRGKHIDEVAADDTVPLVTDNKMTFSLTPCKTKIIIEGRGQLRELVPAGLGGTDDGIMVPHWDDTTFTGDEGKTWIIRDPQRYCPFWEGTLSNGLKGPILVLNGLPCTEDFADWDLETGIVTTKQDLRGATTVEVMTLYLAPFQVIAGPGGDAYDHYGLIREEAIYDDSLIHPTQPLCVNYNLVSTYNPGTLYDCVVGDNQETAGEEYCVPMPPRDDTPMMQAIADTMLSRLGNERINCTLNLDVIDLDRYTLLKAGNLSGLSKWSSLHAQIMTIEIEPMSDRMVCQLTNDVFRTPGYAEWKRRFMLRSDSNSLHRIVDGLRHLKRLGGSSQFTRNT